MSLTLPYYYGQEAEQFSFYRIPKLLITDPKYKSISTDAKLLYGLMLDRMSLSLKNGWVDDENRVFIYFPVEQIMELMNCKSEKASKLLSELDRVKGIGLIERVRQGQGKPSIIYVKNFTGREQFKNCYYAIGGSLPILEIRFSKVLIFDNRISRLSIIENK